MNDRKPAIPARDGAGFFDLDNPDDGSAIEKMISQQDRLLVVTQKFTYEIRLADQIDPKRSNPGLPHNVRQTLFAHGTHSPLLQKTLLQADVLFKNTMQPNLPIQDAIKLVIEFVEQLVALQRTADDFAAEEKSALGRWEAHKQQPRSISLPAVGYIDDTCRTFAQSAHRAGLTFFKIIQLFFPEAKNWDKVTDLAEARFGVADGLISVLHEARPFFRMILDIRDCLLHNPQQATVLNFAMEPTGAIVSPSIAINFRKLRLERVAISEWMNTVCEAFPHNFAILIACVCARTAQPFAGFAVTVDRLPDTYRNAWHVEYCYCQYDDQGNVIPFG